MWNYNDWERDNEDRLEKMGEAYQKFLEEEKTSKKEEEKKKDSDKKSENEEIEQ